MPVYPYNRIPVPVYPCPPHALSIHSGTQHTTMKEYYIVFEHNRGALIKGTTIWYAIYI